MARAGALLATRARTPASPGGTPVGAAGRTAGTRGRAGFGVWAPHSWDGHGSHRRHGGGHQAPRPAPRPGSQEPARLLHRPADLFAEAVRVAEQRPDRLVELHALEPVDRIEERHEPDQRLLAAHLLPHPVVEDRDVDPAHDDARASRSRRAAPRSSPSARCRYSTTGLPGTRSNGCSSLPQRPGGTRGSARRPARSSSIERANEMPDVARGASKPSPGTTAIRCSSSRRRASSRLVLTRPAQEAPHVREDVEAARGLDAADARDRRRAPRARSRAGGGTPRAAPSRTAADRAAPRPPPSARSSSGTASSARSSAVAASASGFGPSSQPMRQPVMQ